MRTKINETASEWFELRKLNFKLWILKDIFFLIKKDIFYILAKISTFTKPIENILFDDAFLLLLLQ